MQSNNEQSNLFSTAHRHRSAGGTVQICSAATCNLSWLTGLTDTKLLAEPYNYAVQLCTIYFGLEEPYKYPVQLCAICLGFDGLRTPTCWRTRTYMRRSHMQFILVWGFTDTKMLAELYEYLLQLCAIYLGFEGSQTQKCWRSRTIMRRSHFRLILN